MTQTFSAYQFEEFIIIPNERLLLRSDVPIHIPPAEFSILTYFVQHPNSIIRADNIPTREVAGNLKYHVMKLRRTLGDDSSKPRFIRSVFGTNGYSFICPVETVDRTSIGIKATNLRDDGRQLTVTSNLFVPMYLGEAIYETLGTKPIKGRLVGTKEIAAENGTLYILPSGFGVWHLAIKGDYANLTDFAYWRRDIYEAIQRGQHSINRFTKEILRASPRKDALEEFVGQPGYVFAVNIAEGLPFRNQDTIRNALQILACPSTLIGDRTDRTRSRGIENVLLKGGVPIEDLLQFGLSDLGFASWDSVSYLRPQNKSLEEAIIEFEIATQVLWWTARCVADVLLAGEPKKVRMVRKLVTKIGRHCSRLKTIGPNETPSERTMIESILKTSRIDRVVGEVLDLEALHRA